MSENPTKPHRLTMVDKVTRTAVCSVCGPTRVRVREGRSTACIATKRASDRRRHRSGGSGRKATLSRYGMTEADYDALLDQQGGGCAICGAPPGARALPVDHDHETSAVRGILCPSCNTGIGLLGDDPDRLLAAAAYLAAARVSQ